MNALLRPLPAVPLTNHEDRFYGIRKPAPAALPPGDLILDLNIPDADYRGADPLTVFAANAERNFHADGDWDDRRGRN